MSVYRDKRSQFFQYEFQIQRRRFYGSTQRDNELEAREVEKEKRRQAIEQLERERAEQRAPLTLGRACERWWSEHGQHLADQKIKSALDRIVEVLGPRPSCTTSSMTPSHAWSPSVARTRGGTQP